MMTRKSKERVRGIVEKEGTNTRGDGEAALGTTDEQWRSSSWGNQGAAHEEQKRATTKAAECTNEQEGGAYGEDSSAPLNTLGPVTQLQNLTIILLT